MMTIENEMLSVRIAEKGAELQSIFGKQEGIEYLWQGDPAYWGSRAHNLFPFVGRLCEERYTFAGKSYPMNCHGFFRNFLHEAKQTSPDSVTFSMSDTPETYAVYPFHFTASLSYRLEGKTLHMDFKVENRGDTTLYCGNGGHPGFNLPLEEGLCFEDYCMEFPEAFDSKIVAMSKAVLPVGTIPYPLEDGKRLHLNHRLFDNDAVVFGDCPRSVTLKSEKGSHGVTVDFPQMPYVGFWHATGKDCPYVCVEPWSVLPGRDGVIEDLATMPDMTAVPAHGSWVNHWSVTVF